jgi:hypothetical protein
MENYYCLCRDREIEDGASIIKHDDLPFKDYKFKEAISLKEHFKEPVAFYMDKDLEDARLCYDVLDNRWSLLLISERMMNAIKDSDCGKVEFLPVKIIDQRNKPIKVPYYIVNTLESVDYIDENKSTLRYSRLIAEDINIVHKLELDMPRIPENRDIFRTKKFSLVYIVSQRLKNKLEQLGLEGLVFVPTDEYDMLYHL